MSNDLVKTESQFTLAAYSNTLKGSLEFAAMLLQTKMVPSHFTNPQAVVTAILYGQELGFSPMQALQSVVVVQGKPTLDSNSLKALILQAGGRIETVEWTDTNCKLRFVRGEWAEEYSFSWEDATKMGLTSKDNWRKMPKAMLYARCISIGARNMFADFTKGFYSTDEMKDSVKSYSNEKTLDAPVNVTPTETIKPKVSQACMYRITPEQFDELGEKGHALYLFLTDNAKRQPNPEYWVSTKPLKKAERFICDWTDDALQVMQTSTADPVDVLFEAIEQGV
jgi:hypothetical protein